MMNIKTSVQGPALKSLPKDVIEFKRTQSEKKIPYLTYMAIFPKNISATEEEFEKDLWTELSAMWSYPEIAGTWDSKFSDNPDDKNFCFSLDGAAFFVVGLHPQSSRLSRRLPFNALVFNLYSQFSGPHGKGNL